MLNTPTGGKYISDGDYGKQIHRERTIVTRMLPPKEIGCRIKQTKNRLRNFNNSAIVSDVTFDRCCRTEHKINNMSYHQCFYNGAIPLKEAHINEREYRMFLCYIALEAYQEKIANREEAPFFHTTMYKIAEYLELDDYKLVNFLDYSDAITAFPVLEIRVKETQPDDTFWKRIFATMIILILLLWIPMF